jgi:hypothetical protein
LCPTQLSKKFELCGGRWRYKKIISSVYFLILLPHSFRQVKTFSSFVSSRFDRRAFSWLYCEPPLEMVKVESKLGCDGIGGPRGRPSKLVESLQTSSFLPSPWQKPAAAQTSTISEDEIRSSLRWYVSARITTRKTL